jgi:hypothetical protein
MLEAILESDDLIVPSKTGALDAVSGTKKYLRLVLSAPTDTKEAIAIKFNRLARRWREETGHMSSIDDICTNNEYQEIINMGEAAIPYILGDLDARPAYWFWALTSITGANPVPTPFQGTFAEAVQLWLDWARQNGYEW